MTISNTGVHKYDADQCREILSHLPEIFAAGLRFEDDQLVEIHVLASIDRSPKQIARDIQSALFATYGIEVDHRIISIAQLPDDPFSKPAEPASSETARPKELRLLFSGIDSSQKDGVYQASVHLTCDGTCHTGNVRCRNTEIQRNRAIATATLSAVNEMLGNDYFNILEVKQISIAEGHVTVTVVEFQETAAGAPLTLIGTALQQDNLPVSIVRSTLDAINRSVSRLYCASAEL